MQLSVGNCLLLKGIWLSVAVTFHAGSTVLEHPAMPYAEDLASVWRSGVLCLLLGGGVPFRRTTVQQCAMVLRVSSPPMLMYSNGSLPKALAACDWQTLPSRLFPCWDATRMAIFAQQRPKNILVRSLELLHTSSVRPCPPCTVWRRA